MKVETAVGALWGLLVGDAVGVPYEFNPPERLPPRGEIEMLPPRGFARSYPHVPAGTWSDDGAQALCLLAALLANPSLDLNDFAARLLAWSREGYMAVDARTFDIGIQTGTALDRLGDGVPARSAGLTGERNNGNGSLMRVLPAALLCEGDDAELVRIAHEQSLPTHGHPRSQVCCALYVLWARREAEGSRNAWNEAVARLHDIYLGESPFSEELNEAILGWNGTPSGSGYVVDTLHSARVACDSGSYEEIIRTAVAFGNDTDTTACVAGGIAGIRHGLAGIPERWRATLRGRDVLDPLIAALRSRLAAR